MGNYVYHDKTVSVISVCGEEENYILIDKERMQSAEQVAKALDVTESDVNRFLFPDRPPEKRPFLCLTTNEMQAKVRILCLLGYAGALARERANKAR